MNVIKVLVVDDQDLFRESLQILLERDSSIKVVGLAENGQEAVKLCERESPNVILMDINMPVMNGVVATREIKSKWPDVKIIILTTFNDIRYVIDALKAGAEGYLLKAISSEDLMAGIHLVHRGGTLITQGMAQLLIDQIPNNDVKSIRQTETEHEEKSHIGMQSTQKRRDKYSLSSREREVLYELSNGLNNREIAQKLFLSEGTVRNYISNIYAKLDVRDRIQAAKKALEEELF